MRHARPAGRRGSSSSSSARGERTVLARRRHHGPLVVQRPFYPEPNGTCHLYVLHPPGGVVGGDRLSVDVRLARGAARALLTTPAAAKFYRTQGLRAAQRLHMRVGAGSRLEWLPQENIVYRRGGHRARDARRARQPARSRSAGTSLAWAARRRASASRAAPCSSGSRSGATASRSCSSARTTKAAAPRSSSRLGSAASRCSARSCAWLASSRLRCCRRCATRCSSSRRTRARARCCRTRSSCRYLGGSQRARAPGFQRRLERATRALLRHAGDRAEDLGHLTGEATRWNSLHAKKTSC